MTFYKFRVFSSICKDNSVPRNIKRRYIPVSNYYVFYTYSLLYLEIRCNMLQGGFIFDPASDPF